MSGTPTYKSWSAMIQRIRRPDMHPAYYGVTIDPRWFDFELFYEDMGRRPDNHQIDRVRGEDGYCKENCRWATRKHNSQNRKLFTTNNTGRNGINWVKHRSRWVVLAMVNGKLTQLYWGTDLFEACCIRAAFEISTNYGGWK